MNFIKILVGELDIDGINHFQVFFFRAYYVKGDINVNENSQVEDYMWATRSELEDIFRSKRAYLKSLKSALTDEDFDYSPSNRYTIRRSFEKERSCVS